MERVNRGNEKIIYGLHLKALKFFFFYVTNIYIIFTKLIKLVTIPTTIS